MSELANNAELEMQRLMEPFNFDDADVVLCVRGADFRVHKLVLTHASTVFKDIFSLPRNPSTSQKSLPVIDIAEDAQTLHDVLSLIYPNAHQIDLDDLSTLHRVLLASRKYSMENLRLMLVKILQAKVDTDPVRVFAIACLAEAPQVALLAARETLKKPYVHIAKFDVPELNQIRAGTFCKLLRYHDRCGELASQKIATPAKRYLVTEHSYHVGERGYLAPCQQSWWAGYIARIRQQLESRVCTA